MLEIFDELYSSQFYYRGWRKPCPYRLVLLVVLVKINENVRHWVDIRKRAFSGPALMRWPWIMEANLRGPDDIPALRGSPKIRLLVRVYSSWLTIAGTSYEPHRSKAIPITDIIPEDDRHKFKEFDDTGAAELDMDVCRAVLSPAVRRLAHQDHGETTTQVQRTRQFGLEPSCSLAFRNNSKLVSGLDGTHSICYMI